MAERPNCRLCDTRKPKRSCPGINAAICPQCCGREREQSIHCPLDCDYLVEGRRHDRPAAADIDFPNKDIRVDEQYIEDNHELFTVVSLSVIKAAQQTSGVIDNDVRDCLDATIKTYLALESGIIYESKPTNMVAAAMQERLIISIAELKHFAFEKTGVHSVKDVDVLKLLVFLQRLEFTSNNGRRYGRAFLSSMRSAFGVQALDNGSPVTENAPVSLII